MIFKNHVDPPPDSTCHHYINHIELSLRIPYQKSISKRVWHYGRANVRALYESCNAFDWRRAFDGKSIDESVELFDSTVLNIARNFIPNEIKTTKAKDPPWFTRECKNFYSKYRKKYRLYKTRGFQPDEKQVVDKLRDRYKNLIFIDKENYIKNLGRQLSNKNNGRKKY